LSDRAREAARHIIIDRKRDFQRTILTLTGIGLLITLALTPGCGGTSTKAEGETSYLFSQSATGGTISSGAAGTHTLTLTGVSLSTIRFSEKPVRRAGIMGTGAFASGWPKIFKDGSPNALLVLATLNDKDVDSVVMTLSGPKYDTSNNTITYMAKEMPKSQDAAVNWEGDQLSSLPVQFGPATLFIDAGEVDATAGKEYYGLCFGDWVKTKPGYDAPTNAFIDT
jgi:hypothetical protein